MPGEPSSKEGTEESSSPSAQANAKDLPAAARGIDASKDRDAAPEAGPEAGRPGTEAAGGVTSTRPSAAPFFARISRAVEKRWVQLFVLLPLLSFIALGLTYGTMNTCFQLIVVPLVVLVIPYYFGLKQARNLLVIGMLSLVVSGVMWGVVDSHCFSERKCGYDWSFVESSEFQALPPAERVIVLGTVDPLSAGPGTVTFSLILNHSRAAALNRSVVEVRVLAGDYGDIIWGSREPYLNKTMVVDNSTNPDQVRWVNTTFVPKSSAFLTEFHVVTRGTAANSSRTYEEESYTLVAPVTGGASSLYSRLIPNRLLLSAGIFGIMLVFMISILWWSRKAREKRETMEKQLRKLEEEEKSRPKPAGKEAEFACTSCGAGVAESDTKCPSCGAVFEAEPAAPGEGENKSREAPNDPGQGSKPKSAAPASPAPPSPPPPPPVPPAGKS